MGDERETIYVEVPGIKIELNLSRKEIHEFGGIESIQQYVKSYIHELTYDLSNPSMKTEFARMRFNLLGQKIKLVGENKNISNFFN